MCRVLCASRPGFYEWRKGDVSPSAARRAQVLEAIKIIHKEFKGVYGSPRMLEELRNRGFVVNHKMVENLMAENAIAAKTKKKFKATTNSNHKLPIAKNLLKRKFRKKKPNQAWVGDISYVWTDEGWLYLATCIDLYSRKIVGWQTSSRIDSDLVVNAFRRATYQGKRLPPLIMHTDRGSQYASDDFRAELKKHNTKQSMSRKADCWDNAVSESFFGSLKRELVHHEKYKTREEAKLSIFKYIETFYNTKRLHSYLNYVSPDQFETCMARA